MSTVAEIWSAIQDLSPQEREKLETLLHADWNVSLPEDETPPNVRQKLSEAAQGKFSEGDRSNISKIISKLK
jgi:hypothetical protein